MPSSAGIGEDAIRLIGVDDYRWIFPRELDGFALPAADHKIIDLLKSRKYGGMD